MIYGRKLDINHGRLGQMPTGARVDRSGAGMPLDGTLFAPGGYSTGSHTRSAPSRTKVLAGSGAFEAIALNRHTHATELSARRPRTQRRTAPRAGHPHELTERC